MQTSAEDHRFRIKSAFENNSPHFARYGKNTSIDELRTFVCDIYPITSSPKNLYDRKQDG